jgi:hypothetical protein
MIEGYVIGGHLKLKIDTEVIAGVDRGGEDLYLVVEAEFFPGNNDTCDGTLQVMLSDRERGIRHVLDCWLEGESRCSEEFGWETEEDAREGSQQDITCWKQLVILPMTEHYEFTKVYTFPEFIDEFMSMVTELPKWQLGRAHGEVGFTWKFKSSLFIDGNAD